jgi:hypothetical protein
MDLQVTFSVFRTWRRCRMAGGRSLSISKKPRPRCMARAKAASIISLAPPVRLTMVGWDKRIRLGQKRQQIAGIDHLAAGVGEQLLQALRNRLRAGGADQQCPLRRQEAIWAQDGHGLFVDEGEKVEHGGHGGPVSSSKQQPLGCCSLFFGLCQQD